jgi:hypothetical protein
MNRWIIALLLVIAHSGCAQTRPAGACPFIGFESDPQKEPSLAEVATKTPAQTWMACDSPTGCFSLRAEPDSPVLIYKSEGEWTCGYGADRNGAASAWFRSKDLRRLEFAADPPIAGWYGIWMSGGDRMVISPENNGKGLHLSGNATWHGANGNEHFGDTKGDAVPAGNRLHYVSGGCVIDLTLAGKYILAEDNQGCGGMNVRFSGFWKRASASRVTVIPPKK